MYAVSYLEINICCRIRREERKQDSQRKAVDDARAANEAKTRFMFNISHDIRTPMNAIMGFSDLLKKHIDAHIKRSTWVIYGMERI